LHIDTEVVKNVIFNSGLYAKHKLVLLDALLESFECIDLRRFSRINTEIPAEIYHEKKKIKGNCLLQDFSERFFRIEVAKENKLLPLLDEGSNVVLRIAVSSREEAMILRGTVFRKR